MDRYTNNVLEQYRKDGMAKVRDPDYLSPLPPHVYAIADNAYRLMNNPTSDHQKRNQSILVRRFFFLEHSFWLYRDTMAVLSGYSMGVMERAAQGYGTRLRALAAISLGLRATWYAKDCIWRAEGGCYCCPA